MDDDIVDDDMLNDDMFDDDILDDDILDDDMFDDDILDDDILDDDMFDDDMLDDDRTVQFVTGSGLPAGTTWNTQGVSWLPTCDDTNNNDDIYTGWQKLHGSRGGTR